MNDEKIQLFIKLPFDKLWGGMAYKNGTKETNSQDNLFKINIHEIDILTNI